MVLIGKLIVALIVIAVAVQQLSTYYAIVIEGNYFLHASIAGIIVTGVAWPLAILAIAGLALWAIFRFDPKTL